jgi:hypothetical protein
VAKAFCAPIYLVDFFGIFHDGFPATFWRPQTNCPPQVIKCQKESQQLCQKQKNELK